MKKILLLTILCSNMIFFCKTQLYAGSESTVPVFIGTETTWGSPPGQGIYMCTLDLDTKKISQPELKVESINPSYIILNGNVLYAVNEIDNFQWSGTGSVSSFKINKDRTLTPIDQKSSGLANPVYLSVSSDRKYLFLANYGNAQSGTSGVSVMPLNSDGMLEDVAQVISYTGHSIDPDRQAEPHTHCINVLSLKDGRQFVMSVDLGTDKIYTYKLGREGNLTDITQTSVDPGSGPRHIAFGPSGQFVYLTDELKSNVNVLSFNPDNAKLTLVQTEKTYQGNLKADRNYPSEVLMHPNGKFLYVSNRGQDTIVLFSIEPDEGKLTYLSETSAEGSYPRDFTIDKTGSFMLVANQNSANAVLFTIDKKTGELTMQNSVEIPTPVTVKFMD